jgi:hypothetical protein
MSDWLRPVPIFEGEDEASLKREFAETWAKHPSFTAYDVGAYVFRNLREPHRGSQAAHVWSKELDVLEMVAELKRQGGANAANADKEQVKLELLAIARGTRDPKEAVGAYKLYAEIEGWVGKNETNVNVAVVNRVMKVRDHGDDDQWEDRARRQQAALTADNAATAH